MWKMMAMAVGQISKLPGNKEESTQGGRKFRCIMFHWQVGHWALLMSGLNE